jgi:2-haloacid dehalogenase
MVASSWPSSADPDVGFFFVGGMSMQLNRRECFNLVAGGLATKSLQPTSSDREKPTIKVVAFDAFPIFDPRPIFALAETFFPGKGNELSNAWRTRQFEYQWLRALAGHYSDFWHATEESLVFATRMLKLNLTVDQRKRLMGAYLELGCWPDVPAVLKSLKDAGLRLALLSNATLKILEAGVANAGLRGDFDHVLSTDVLKTYKPDPRAYQLAVDAFRARREEIAFVAFAGWDVAGAKWFGYTSFWVNRLDAPAEELGVATDGVGRDLTDLVKFLRARH